MNCCWESMDYLQKMQRRYDDLGAGLTFDFLFDDPASSSLLVGSELTGLCSCLVSSLLVSLITWVGSSPRPVLEGVFLMRFVGSFQIGLKSSYVDFLLDSWSEDKLFVTTTDCWLDHLNDGNTVNDHLKCWLVGRLPIRTSPTYAANPNSPEDLSSRRRTR